MTRPAAPTASVVLRAADGSRAVVTPFGAHVTRWITADGREQLYLSGGAALDGSAPIRGGIPVIFPQFAAEGTLPKHGFARTATWGRTAADGADDAQASFVLADSPATRAVWPHAFKATVTVLLRPDALEVRLLVANTGGDPIAFTAALHTYLAMDDAFGAEVAGLEGLAYRDSITREPGRQREPVLRVDGAVNRVYAGTPSRLVVRDGARAVELETAGFADAVVWNPGPQGEAAIGDMPAGDARRMLCVEPAVIEHPVLLQPGEQWEGSQRLASR